MGKSNPHICFISQQVYCYLTDGNYESAGGAERQQYLLGKELRRRGFEISYITGDYGGLGEETIDSITLKRSIPMNVGFSGAHKKFLGLFRAMRNLNADIYYVRSSLVLFIFATAISKIINKRIVYVVASDQTVEPERLDDLEHGWFSNISMKRLTQPIIKRLYLRSVGDADQVITLTNHQKQVLQEEYDIPATVVPVGYDLPPADDILDPSEREYFFWAGRLTPDKHPDTFLDAAAQLPDEEFVMAGPKGGHPEFTERVIKTASSMDNVTYIGYVKPTTIHEYFKKSMGFIQTTGTTAGFGNTTLEAWRFATPVVSLHSNFDGTIEQRELGLYADGSVDLLAEHIEALSDSPEQIDKYGWNGREYLDDHFSLASIGDSYEEILTDVVG
ncbi:glycosyltransferase family 4 protein [Halomicrobium sp. IBSBa]|uniref:glycosyltransferase family 4 protein n=1 Tax=Halomicrobium sp. IBSBa TaxID=2778916 RepID=UPI001ABF96A8|nr:glycosyltransferase family 4 protein [Halomicrobium sp. IBSBa]MBO4248892.1 glycosyltransferase family 4 protein [Halomicrobium sp. IBSBa]